MPPPCTNFVKNSTYCNLSELIPVPIIPSVNTVKCPINITKTAAIIPAGPDGQRSENEIKFTV